MTTVCLITTAHPTYDKRIFHKEAKALNNEGFEVKLIAHAEENTIRDGIEVISLGKKNSKLDRIRHLKDAYKLATNLSADVYHLHDPELLPIGVLLSRNTDGKIIFDAHEDYGQNAVDRRPWIPDLGKELVRRGYPFFQQYFTKQFDAVITTTEQIATEFRRRDYPNVSIVRNFPITEQMRIISPSVQPKHEYTLVYVGALSETRGLTPMLETHRILRQRGVDVGLWLIGPFQGEADKNKQRVSRFLMKHDLEDHARLFGYIPHEEIFGYLDKADVGLALVNKKQFNYILPTKIFEYMYTELPVVMTNTGPGRDYVSEEYGALVDDNPENTAEIIYQWLQNDCLDEMGAAGKQKILTEYNWEHEKKELIHLYSDLI